MQTYPCDKEQFQLVYIIMIDFEVLLTSRHSQSPYTVCLHIPSCSESLTKAKLYGIGICTLILSIASTDTTQSIAHYKVY